MLLTFIHTVKPRNSGQLEQLDFFRYCGVFHYFEDSEALKRAFWGQNLSSIVGFSAILISANVGFYCILKSAIVGFYCTSWYIQGKRYQKPDPIFFRKPNCQTGKGDDPKWIEQLLVVKKIIHVFIVRGHHQL